MRPNWNDYFFSLAKLISSRSTCPRLSVGCVIVKEKRILTSGYNGALKGEPHCNIVGCKMVDGHCIRAVHAETNAIAQAAKHGISVDGAVCYITHQACPRCELLLKASGIKQITFKNKYVTKKD